MMNYSNEDGIHIATNENIQDDRDRKFRKKLNMRDAFLENGVSATGDIAQRICQILLSKIGYYCHEKVQISVLRG